MRFLGFLFIFVLTFAALSLKPELFSATLQATRNSYVETFYQRDLHITGNQKLTKSNIEAFLPKTSNLHWYFAPEQIEKIVEAQPAISKLRVNSCESNSFSCYEIAVEEEEPSYIAQAGGAYWAVAANGSQLFPIDRSELQSRLQEIPILLASNANERKDPEALAARHRHLATMLPKLEEELSEKILSAEILPAGRLSVRSRALPYELVFSDFSMLGDEGQELIKKEVRRLRHMQDMMPEKVKEIAVLDLTPAKQAVAKMRAVEENIDI